MVLFEKGNKFGEGSGGEIKLGPRQIASSNLNLLELMLGRKRDSIRSDMCRMKFKASNYEDVVEYIKLKIVKIC